MENDQEQQTNTMLRSKMHEQQVDFKSEFLKIFCKGSNEKISIYIDFSFARLPRSNVKLMSPSPLMKGTNET